MQEKEMVNDLLTQLKGSLSTYANAIAESANPQLRQALQQIRNDCETFQYDLYKLAEQKGYYRSAQQVEQNEVMQVKSQFIS
ncbi:spore coat protein [Herbivorax sp. ANBcel31]|uniref:spore coat protein n=1 Tax=Herbivorax sp. ANBcel31 TaxID=3069754 RepID=UPI0027B4DF76|nr:spore coat protein [Herbivorax sp. ANBcel31]MDQ2086616.1 spore coat protein [Herbivorax sp. ANBcel31]